MRQNISSFWPIFCPFTSLTTKKIKILKKWKNHLEILSVYTHVYHKWQPYDVCFLRYGLWQTEFFVTLDRFLPFYSPKNPKSQNFEMKKTSGGYYFIHVYQKWQWYDVWFLRYEVWQTKFFVILDCFCPFCHFGLLFASLITPKIKTLKNWKKMPRDFIILHKCTKNYDHMPYC